MDLKEFLLAVELVAARTPEDKLLWAFRQYDIDNSGCVDREEMIYVIESIQNMLKTIGEAPQEQSWTISTKKIVSLAHAGLPERFRTWLGINQIFTLVT